MAPPAGVISNHRVGVDPAGRTVDEDRRGPGAQLGDEVVLTVARGHDDQAVDAAGDEVVDQLLLALALLVEARGEDGRAAPAGDVLEGAVHLRAEVVGEVLEDRGDGRAAAVCSTQATGVKVPS